MKLILRFFASAAVLSLILTLIYSLPPFSDYSQVSAQSSDSKISTKQREDAYRANNLGVAQLEQFNHKEAADLFRRALTLDPRLGIASINLTIALFNQQEIEAAQTAAMKAIEIAPETSQPHYILGLIAKNQNRTEEAVALFQRVLAKDPTDVGANVNLGQIYI